MLGKISKHHSKKRADVHPHEWVISGPPSKSRRFRSSNDFPVVPSPSIFCDVAIPYSLRRNAYTSPTFEQYPTPGHVASHLLLIECFQQLRSEVESSQAIAAAFRSYSQSYLSGSSSACDGSWNLYLIVAIKRFKLWITRIEDILRHSAVFNRYGTGSHLHGAFTENYLPPIDVLLIWYAYLQNPAAYERLIASNGFTLLSQICFPWHLFPDVIDQTTLEYRFSPAARALWNKTVGLPAELPDSIGREFDSSESAFTSRDSEIFDVTLRQTCLIEEFQKYHWLRSPALSHTIHRAISRYADSMVTDQLSQITRTQQIPVLNVEMTRGTDELDLDLPAQLILNTHRAYHAAWQAFAQLYNVQTDERLPPPSYDEAQTQLLTPTSSKDKEQSADSSPLKPGSTKRRPDLKSCFCWTCERVKDDLEEAILSSPSFPVPLSPVSSPEEIESPYNDEKQSRTVISTISSDSDVGDEPTSGPKLDLSRKQIKAIINDVAMYQRIEELRQRKRKDFMAHTEAG